MINNIFNYSFFVTSYVATCKSKEFYVYESSGENLGNLLQHRCVVLTLPGAFTPTCTLKHVPDFEAQYDLILSYGIKNIYIMTSNDYWTHRVWADAMRIKKLKFISDYELAFANHFGNALYRNGLGVRNRREIIIFDKCKIEKRITEKYESNIDDPYDKTQSKNLLDYLKTL